MDLGNDLRRFNDAYVNEEVSRIKEAIQENEALIKQVAKRGGIAVTLDDLGVCSLFAMSEYDRRVQLMQHAINDLKAFHGLTLGLHTRTTRGGEHLTTSLLVTWNPTHDKAYKDDRLFRISEQVLYVDRSKYEPSRSRL